MGTWQELACKKRMAADLKRRNGELSTVKLMLKEEGEGQGKPKLLVLVVWVCLYSIQQIPYPLLLRIHRLHRPEPRLMEDVVDPRHQGYCSSRTNRDVSVGGSGA